VVGFLYIEFLNCHFDLMLHLSIVTSRKMRVLFLSCSSVNYTIGDTLLNSSKISLMSACIDLDIVKI
jgi:hypothetical protein